MEKILSPIPFYKTEITHGFWKRRQDVNSDVTIHAVYDRFKETGRFDAMRCQWTEQDGEEMRPHYFWDSDVAKWIEGAANIIKLRPSPELERLCDATINDIVSNQGEDGYFNVYFTVVEPDQRFTHRDMHELYCAGHLMEAAVAYYEATGKRKFLDAMCRFADYIEERFKIKRDTAFKTSGHQEIEIALFRLYECTGEQRYFDLAEFFVNERGPDDARLGPTATHAYNQSHLPVREQRYATGHAVRAAYLYAAMADLAAYTADEELFVACDAIFDDISKRKMYITGGVGSSASGEAYTVDYDLPNILSYSESCAGMVLIFFASRMLSLNPDSKYSDVIERVLYNNFLSNTSIDGDSFFYTNPLEVIPYIYYKDTISQYYRIKYPRPSRSKVFKTSCCPCNVVRVVSSLAQYIWGSNDERLFVHQYMNAKTEVEQGGSKILVTMETNYPVDGKVKISASGGDLQLAVRIPGWFNGYKGETEKGYAYMTVSDGASAEFDFEMSPVIIEANPRVLYDSQKCAVMRGPVVYCSEAVDNGDLLRNIRLDVNAPITELADGEYAAPCLIAKGWRRTADENAPLYHVGVLPEREVDVKLIPYYAFANRGECEMQVWINEKR